MENIVFGLKKLNFEQNTVNNKILTERCAINFDKTIANQRYPWRFLPASFTANPVMSSVNVESEMVSNFNADTVDISATYASDSTNEDTVENSDKYEYLSDRSVNANEIMRRGGICLRRLPARASKDALKLSNTKIGKPKKRAPTDFKVATCLSEFKKIYTTQKLTKFNRSNLETIFENDGEEQGNIAECSENVSEINSQVQFVHFGNRKLRRSISFNDGLNTNKALVKRRRAKIKKSFGRGFAWKKISMTEFHDRLNKTLEGGEMCEQNDIAEYKAQDDIAVNLSGARLEMPLPPSATEPKDCLAILADAEMNLMSATSQELIGGQCNGARCILD